MADKINDLTGSPEPPRVMRWRSLSVRRRSRTRRSAIKASCTMNPNGCCINQCVASWIHKRLAALNCALCPIATNSTTHAATNYVPIIHQLGAASLYPHGFNLNEASIPHHEFLKGTMKYWRRRLLSKIAWNVMWNRTRPPQVHSYAKSFFGQQPYEPQSVTLPLFPEEATFSSVAPSEIRNIIGNTYDGFHMMEGDLDLELNLGRS